MSLGQLSWWPFLGRRFLDVQLTVVAKVYWGDAKEKICDAVIEIPLDALIMGSRGFGTFKRYTSTLLLCDVRSLICKANNLSSWFLLQFMVI